MSSLLRIVMSVLFYVFAVLRYVFYRAISSFLTVIMLLLVSILMFVTFYQAYMPVVSHVKPVYLQFSTDCKDKMSALCSYPEARVMFGSSNKANEQRMLMRGQTYKVFLDIEMPPSPINQKLGMFMVNIEFISADGVVLKTSSRSCMLPYESYLVKLFRTFFLSLPLTLGMTEEKKKVEMIFFDDYVDDSYKPAVQAKVVILTKQIEIYSSTLRLQASFTGLRYLIFNWPLVFSFAAIFANFITVTLLYTACVNQLTPSFYASNNSPRAEACTPQHDTELRNNRNGSSTIGRSLTPASLEMPQADVNTVISNGIPELISDNLRENPSACSSSEHNEDVASNLSHVQTSPLPRRNNRRPNRDERFEDVVIPAILRNSGNYPPSSYGIGRRRYSRVSSVNLKFHRRREKIHRTSYKKVDKIKSMARNEAQQQFGHNSKEIVVDRDVMDTSSEVHDSPLSCPNVNDASFDGVALNLSSSTKTAESNKLKRRKKRMDTNHTKRTTAQDSKISTFTQSEILHREIVGLQTRGKNKQFHSDMNEETRGDFSQTSLNNRKSLWKSFSLIPSWNGFKLPRRSCKYFQGSIGPVARGIRNCVSDLELTTVEKHRLSELSGQKRSASTSDLTSLERTAISL